MKIVMLTLNTIGRGTYLRAFKFASELAKRGHDITLIATKEKGRRGISEFSEDSVKIVAFPDLFTGALRSGWDPYNCLLRIAWLRDKKYDIVHAFESRPTVIYPALFLKNKGTALVMDWCDWFGRGGAVEERPSWIIRSFLRPIETYFEEHFRDKASLTTVICSTLFERTRKLGQPEERLLLLPNGLDMPELRYIDLLTARKKLGIPQNEFLIGYVGASFQRDITLMEETFKMVVDKIPSARLIHVGRSNYLISHGFKYSDRIITTGNVDNFRLNEYLSACNICWLPLKNTNANRGRFPLKLSTYLAVGRPVVATRVGDIIPIFERYNIGLLSIDEPSAIAEKIVEIFHSPDLIAEQSKNAQELCRNPNLSWRQRAIELEQAYSKVLLNNQVKN
jgi:glycosyltransferase involved in cell wall biosynthesis